MVAPHSSVKPSSIIAYFSMEVGLSPEIPTYSGGLGMLAGDTLRAAADMNIPMVGITLLHRKGYFLQRLDAGGNQIEADARWVPEEMLQPLEPRVQVIVGGKTVSVRAWQYTIRGVKGHMVPVYLLDTNLPENDGYSRTLTDHLYGGDLRYRLCQEVILGLGGVAVLRAMGHNDVLAYHMNEGHSALLTLALLEEQSKANQDRNICDDDKEAVRRKCVFTTHTPVPAGHDVFSLELAREIVGGKRLDTLLCTECCLDQTLNMTNLALSLSRYINGVAMYHGEISRTMYPNYPINSITNGVHSATWTSKPFQDLYDRHMPEWRRDNLYLRYAVSVPLDEIRQAHAVAKKDMLDEIQRRTGIALDPSVMTIGFARRATAYKRADLLFSDMERLKNIVSRAGPLQVIFGGKAHPRDDGGKEIIKRVFESSGALKEVLPVVYLEEYDMGLGKILCSGVDLWLNTPQKPHEASGTSGMKAALNGVPSFSVPDGWWIEGHVEGITGWSIGDSWGFNSVSTGESESLYDKLENIIVPMFYGQPGLFARVMRSAIGLNGSFFNAQRMVSQYLENAYLTG
ncbi:MAG: alpha-glucan family phosphorylase [Dehalococcoidia bacterium]|nr:alpha-glucan family phosphorylase [Dehalococcoidia bacterium]